MIAKPMDVLEQFPIRKTEAQKQAFREAAVSYARDRGYEVTVQSGKRGVNNIVIGDPLTAKYLVTAHYDTPASIGIPNIGAPCNPVRSRLMFFVSMFLSAGLSSGSMLLIKAGYWIPGIALLLVILGLILLLLNGPANRNNANDNTSGVVTVLEILGSMPDNFRNRVCFVLFDLEEKGKRGSAFYRKANKEVTESQIILNLDCVGDGDHILMMANKDARKNNELVSRLSKLGGWYGNKQILIIDEGYCDYNSDHKNFPLGVGVAAFHKKRRDYILDKIHTKHDTNLDITNVNILRAAIISLICAS